MKLGPRIAVVGTSGAGKTTFSARLAARLDCPHIELDAFQHRPQRRRVSRYRPTDKGRLGSMTVPGPRSSAACSGSPPNAGQYGLKLQ